MASYDWAIKVLQNRKKYSKKEIREAIGVYHSVNRLSRCPVCNQYKLHAHGDTPCLSCLQHYSTKLNFLYVVKGEFSDPEDYERALKRKAEYLKSIKEKHEAAQKAKVSDEDEPQSRVRNLGGYGDDRSAVGGCFSIIIFGTFLMLNGVFAVKSLLLG